MNTLTRTPEETKSRRNRIQDDMVLWIIIAFCLIMPVVFIFLWIFNKNLFCPPMFISILLGIAIAALTYRYLGGTDGSNFSIGLLKVTGSAALLLGTAYLANDGLSSQMDADAKYNVEKLNNARSELEKTRSDFDAVTQSKYILTNQIKSLENQLNIKESTETDTIISTIRTQSPSSSLGSKLVEMARKRQGPFSKIWKSIPVKVTSIDAIKDESSFTACSDLDLAGEEIHLVFLIGEETRSIDARQSGLIESVICDKKNERKFDIQISCKAGLKLFPQYIAGCDNNGTVKWNTPNGQRNFEATAEISNKL